jgi:photosystem II stability/assembly factor-like uncharacterized protein
MMKTIFLLTTIISLSLMSYGQVPEALDARIRGKHKLAEIMAEVEDYYRPILAAAASRNNIRQAGTEDEAECETCKEGLDLGYQHWKRWEYYNRSRLTDDGRLQNVARKNFDARILAKQSNIGINSSFTGAWSFKGPTNQVNSGAVSTGVGRANALAFHPTDANTMWAATSSGGLFKTINGGTSWFSIADDISSLGIADVVVNYNNPNILYIITGDGDSNNGSYWFIQDYGYLRFSTGVLKSVDGGSTWQKTGLSYNSSDFKVGFKLAIHPTNPNILLAATNDGLYKTADGGNTWTLVKTSATTGGFYDVKFKLDDGSIAFATERGYGSKLLISNTTGDTWSSANVTGLASNIYRTVIGLTPANADSVFVLCGKSVSANTYKGLYKAKYNAATNALAFTLVHNSPNIISVALNGIDYSSTQDAAEYDLSLAVSPVSTSNIVAGATFARYSTDAGVTFFNPPSQPHADIHQMAYNPLNNVLYISTDGGIYKSTNNGNAYTAVTQGLSATQVYHMADFEPDNNVFLIGTQDNGTNYKTTASSDILNIAGCDGFAAAIHPTNSSILMGVCNTNVFGSSTGGASFINNFNPPTHNTWYSLVGFNPLNANIRYIGGQDSLYRSGNGGTSWTAYAYRGNSAFHICPASNRIYAAGAGIVGAVGGAKLTRIDNDFGIFTDLTTATNMPSFAGNSTYITSIATHPTNNADVWITISGYRDGIKVYHSTNSGGTWTNESKNLPNVPVNAVTVDPSGSVYVGNDFGVFARRSTDQDWMPFYNGLPNVPITDLKINETVQTLKASTFGRGVWETTTLSATCPVSLIVNASYIGQYNFQASDNINMSGTVQNSDGTKVTMNAGNYITLAPGFVAGANSFFKAQIAPCGPVDINRGTVIVEPTPIASPINSKQQKEPVKIQLKKQNL